MREAKVGGGVVGEQQSKAHTHTLTPLQGGDHIYTHMYIHTYNHITYLLHTLFTFNIIPGERGGYGTIGGGGQFPGFVVIKILHYTDTSCYGTRTSLETERRGRGRERRTRQPTLTDVSSILDIHSRLYTAYTYTFVPPNKI